jgi:hypothetical protein
MAAKRNTRYLVQFSDYKKMKGTEPMAVMNRDISIEAYLVLKY